MPTDPPTVLGLDEVALSFLKESDDEQAERKLSALINTHARPLIHRIIASTIRFSPRTGIGHAEDLEDIYSDTAMKLVVGLRKRRSIGSPDSIENLRSYMAVATYNCCYSYLRQKYPGRSKLRDKIQYVLRHQEGLATDLSGISDSGIEADGYDSHACRFWAGIAGKAGAQDTALLPLDDAAIATRLGSTRQQVINLRKAARERLARRLVGKGLTE
jgi:hypothetical protein